MKITSDLLKDKKHIHFIGIGGSGMFPLVQILHSLGYEITGSDNNPGDTIDFEVQQLGIPVVLGQKPENIRGADLIVHTAAIMDDNPELMAARASGVPTVERSVLLGEVTTWFQNCVCVSGTHGKTTTSALLTQILLDCGLDPSAVIGGKLESLGGSGRLGSSEAMVCEACEFVDTFLKLSPDIAVILDIDDDHLDYFKTVDNLIASFRKFASKASRCVIANGDDPKVARALEGLALPKLLTYGLDPKNDYSARNIVHHQGRCSYELLHHGEALCTVSLQIPGVHNVLNSIAALAAALELGAPLEEAVASAQHFGGVHRRFEILGTVNGVTIADDYAHHPTEIEAVLRAAKEMGFRQVWAVHQPFTYSRTAMLLDDFARVLSLADHVVLSEIMGSREKNTYNIYAKDLADKIPGAVWFPSFQEIADYVRKNAQAGDFVLTMGCGDIYKCAKIMVGAKPNTIV